MVPDYVKNLVSIVVPVYNEEDSLSELYTEIERAFKTTDYGYEVIFVDDGSRDRSVEVVEKLAVNKKNVISVQFQRNYGKAAALSEGFNQARGEFIATLDADLQDDPEEIPQMIEMLGTDYDLVSGWKKKRHDPLGKRIPSKIFNRVTSFMTGIKVHDSNCGIKVYRCDVAKTLDIYGGLYRYIPSIAALSGFKVTEKIVRHRPRMHGSSKYGGSRLYHGFWDLVTVLFLGRYVRRPLHLFGFPGIASFLAGLAISIYLTIGWFRGVWIGNRPMFFLGILLLIVGLQFISLGLLGEMIAYGHKRSYYIVRNVIKPDSEKSA